MRVLGTSKLDWLKINAPYKTERYVLRQGYWFEKVSISKMTLPTYIIGQINTLNTPKTHWSNGHLLGLSSDYCFLQIVKSTYKSSCQTRNRSHHKVYMHYAKDKICTVTVKMNTVNPKLMLALIWIYCE